MKSINCVSCHKKFYIVPNNVMTECHDCYIITLQEIQPRSFYDKILFCLCPFQ